MTNARFAELFGGAAARARSAADPARHGPRRLDPGGDRGSCATADCGRSPLRPACAICASPVASHSIASPTAKCCATAIRPISGFSRPPATPAAPSARRSPPTTNTKNQPRRQPTARMDARRLSRSRFAGRDRAPLGGGRRAVRGLAEDAAVVDADGAGAHRRQSGRLVPGPDGVRPARARRPLYSRRPALAHRCRRRSI